jgi:uncharacterized protein
MANASDIARLIQLNGGELTGKTRLQKSAYFLEVKGLGFGFDFNYYRFGPYSEELTNFADDALALDLIGIHWKESQGGTRYAVFHSKQLNEYENEHDSQRRSLLKVLNGFSSIELELAATADFLKRNGYSNDPWAETKRRKATKVDSARLIKSKRLLQELGGLEYTSDHAYS